MKSKRLDRDGLRTTVVVFDAGDRVLESLVGFVRAHGLTAGHMTAIGRLPGGHDRLL